MKARILLSHPERSRRVCFSLRLFCVLLALSVVEGCFFCLPASSQVRRFGQVPRTCTSPDLFAKYDTSSGTWKCDPGPSTTPHNLLSATHPDTQAASPPAAGDLIYGDASLWKRLPRGADGQCLTSSPTTIQWGSCAAGGGDNISVNGTAATDADFDDATPAAPANSLNVRWQKDALSPNNISANLPYASPLGVTSGNLTVTGIVGPALGGTGANNTPTAGRYLRGDGANFVTSSVAAGGAGSCTNQVVTATNDNAVPTCADVTGAMIAADTIAAGDVAAALDTRSLTYIAGCDNCAVLPDADDQLTFWRNNVAAMTITEVWCESDAGSPLINLQRDDGTPANILSANLTCSTTGATGSIDAAEDNLAVGDKLDFVLVTAGGTAKRVTVSVKATID